MALDELSVRINKQKLHIVFKTKQNFFAWNKLHTSLTEFNASVYSNHLLFIVSTSYLVVENVTGVLRQIRSIS